MVQLSLVIAVYNRADVLQLVLASVARQSFRDFEVVIADDGSGPGVRDVIEDARKIYSFPTVHAWHEDLGWRKNIAMNNAVRSSSGEYLVFVDGDCLLSKYFLEDHWKEREVGKVLLGRRVEMSERWTKSITMDKITKGRFEHIGFSELLDGLKGKAVRLEDGVRIGNKTLRKLISREKNTILGSNFSLYKSDLYAINGFDGLYDGPGLGEDSDVQYRLSLTRVNGKSIRNLAIEFHMYHKRTVASEESARRFEAVMKSKVARCNFGLDQVEPVEERSRRAT